MPLAEAQSQWNVDSLVGRYGAPATNEIRQQMLADHERNRRQFYLSARHTMEVDFDYFLWDLRRARRRGARRAAVPASAQQVDTRR